MAQNDETISGLPDHLAEANTVAENIFNSKSLSQQNEMVIAIKNKLKELRSQKIKALKDELDSYEEHQNAL